VAPGLLRSARNDGEAELASIVTILRRCERSNPDGGMKQPCVYIVASRRNGTLYTGVTADLPRRIFEHREGLIAGFSKKYGCKRLVWYELHETMTDAITREKQIKAGSRAKKLELIECFNPEWTDFFESIF
jgi:predicted GIY-YIG superfamily endonuclease